MTKRIPEPDQPSPAQTAVEGRTVDEPAVDEQTVDGPTAGGGGAGDADLLEYARHPRRALRQRLVLRYRPLVMRVVARTAARLPAHVERSDLTSAGMVGLLEALDRFDPGRGHVFESYAAARIRGAVLDEVRAIDGAPRSYWSKRREVDRVVAVLGNTFGTQPATTEVSRVAGLAESEVKRLRGDYEAPQGLDQLSTDDAARHAFPCPRDPEQAALDADTQQRLLLAVDRLPDRAYRIIEWYYRHELTFGQIAARLGITETRVHQLHARALGELRRRLGAR